MVRTIKLSNGEEISLPIGVEVRGSNIRIRVKYPHGFQYEVLAKSVTKQTIKAASIKRERIEEEIRNNSIKWLQHFPESKHARRAAGLNGETIGSTFGQVLDQCYEAFKKRVAPSTLKGHAQAVIDMKAFFGENLPLRLVTLKQCEAYRDDQAKTRQAKTVNSRLAVLRDVLKFGYKEQLFEYPLHSLFKDLPKKHSRVLLTKKELEQRAQENFQPLNLSEMQAVYSVKESNLQSARDMALLASWTGLCVAELMALSWHDIETDGDQTYAYIRRNEVEGVLKATKTTVRTRKLELNKEAVRLLKSQMAKTRLLPPITVSVLAGDNQTWFTEIITPVFRNPYTGERWLYESYRRGWKRVCIAAGIEYRSPNRMRHTYASRMLSGGISLRELTHIMGHVSEDMLRKHYAAWIHSDQKGKIASLQNAIIDALKVGEF